MYDIYDKIGVSAGGDEAEPYRGYVTKAIESATLVVHFNYSVSTSAKFSIQTSSMPGSEYIQPTETIRTSRLDINFVINDKITLHDGRVMTVREVDYEDDENRTTFDNGHIAWVLTLIGGQV